MVGVRITVMRKAFYPDLSRQYENPISDACCVEEGQIFTVYSEEKPEGLCQSAWETLLPFVHTLLNGGGHFYGNWMKNSRSAMISCNDGFRPVSFLAEALDETDERMQKG